MPDVQPWPPVHLVALLVSLNSQRGPPNWSALAATVNATHATAYTADQARAQIRSLCGHERASPDGNESESLDPCDNDSESLDPSDNDDDTWTWRHLDRPRHPPPSPFPPYPAPRRKWTPAMTLTLLQLDARRVAAGGPHARWIPDLVDEFNRRHDETASVRAMVSKRFCVEEKYFRCLREGGGGGQCAAGCGKKVWAAMARAFGEKGKWMTREDDRRVVVRRDADTYALSQATTAAGRSGQLAQARQLVVDLEPEEHTARRRIGKRVRETEVELGGVGTGKTGKVKLRITIE
ncbi:hypothetical protein HDU96_009394 [Phlyctochytrium bullatum]|nr:hypothetical protein HDU96_009394 [Phlyctochytrium bullatum]